MYVFLLWSVRVQLLGVICNLSGPSWRACRLGMHITFPFRQSNHRLY